jgi:hypothetical protein
LLGQWQSVLLDTDNARRVVDLGLAIHAASVAEMSEEARDTSGEFFRLVRSLRDGNPHAALTLLLWTLAVGNGLESEVAAALCTLPPCATFLTCADLQLDLIGSGDN